MNQRRIPITLFLAAALAVAGCQKKTTNGGAGASGQKAAPVKIDKSKPVKLAYVEWSSAVASANVVKDVLETKLGYKVKLIPVSAAAMWQAVAVGDADGMLSAWLPTTHAAYYKRFHDQVDDLGPNLKGTKIGLVVPDYVTIDSITQLPANKAKFDGKIIGIDPGAGIMDKTEKALKAYDLKGFKLVSGSGATMGAALGDAIQNHKWMVVTGWTPHWMFAQWKLKFLKDPKKIYGGAETIHTVVRQKLKGERPELYRFLDAFHWTIGDMNSVIVANHKKDDPAANAKAFVAAHPKLVDAWVAAAEGKAPAAGAAGTGSAGTTTGKTATGTTTGTAAGAGGK